MFSQYLVSIEMQILTRNNNFAAGCWLEFLEEIKENYINEGGNLICTIIERELNSLPRGLFFLPPEKSEPLTYSYLPQTSVCRTFVEHLQKQLKSNDKNIPSHVTEIIRVLSEDYTKLLPPLNWEFLSRFIGRGSDCNRHTLGLLIKQAQQSKSAKQMIESYLSAIDWSCEKVKCISFYVMGHSFSCYYYYYFQNFTSYCSWMKLPSCTRRL